ncbi:hypothetical protein [Saccharopolyspora erythraea]|uniref:hypothetical protein n=1 Tax=Saccharopolyspora erythraea TaxID=1836 RepID=UPI002012EB2B|nr:hypothetical protein [Saccharopolyspora erythraea]
MRKWVESGKGAQPLYDNSAEWSSEKDYLLSLAEKVSTKLNEAGVIMQSKSGEAMQDAVAPVVLWTEVTAENAQAQSQIMTEQGEAFKKVHSSIPASGEEQSVPDDTWIEEGWDSMWNGQTDAEAAKAHNEKLRQEAVTAFNNYDSASQSTVGASAVFTPPPPGGMETTVSGGQHTGVGGMTPAPGGGTGGGVPAGSGSAGYSGGSGGFGSGGSGSGGSGGSGGGYTPPSTTTPNWDGSTRGPGDSGWRPGPQGPNNPYGPNTGIIPPGGGQGPNQGGGTGRGGSGGGRGPGVGAGGRSGGGVGAGGGRGALGPGGQSGVGAGGRAGVGGGVPGAGGAGGAGGRGGAGAMGGAGARGRGQEGEEDLEHETPDYLKGDHGFFDDELPKVAPPVFGDWNQK